MFEMVTPIVKDKAQYPVSKQMYQSTVHKKPNGHTAKVRNIKD